MKCPFCKDVELDWIEEAHCADSYFQCRICGATWSEGKDVEHDDLG